MFVSDEHVHESIAATDDHEFLFEHEGAFHAKATAQGQVHPSSAFSADPVIPRMVAHDHGFFSPKNHGVSTLLRGPNLWQVGSRDTCDPTFSTDEQK